MAFSPEGRFCLSGSLDHTLRLWDASAGECVRTFEGHTDCVTSVAFSPEGRFCLSGSYDKTLRLWDASTGRCLRTYEGHPVKMHSVAFTPDGRVIAPGTRDDTLRLWDTSTGECVRTLEGHTSPVSSVAFSPDGRFCLSGSGDKTLRLWNASTGECVRTFEGHTSPVRSVAFSPNGRLCLSGSTDHTLRLWELDWEYEFPGWADWDDGARPYLEHFLTLHGPYGDDGFPCAGQPAWTEGDFQTLLIDLQRCGYGWLREEGVRKKLEEMTAEKMVASPPSSLPNSPAESPPSSSAVLSDDQIKALSRNVFRPVEPACATCNRSDVKLTACMRCKKMFCDSHGTHYAGMFACPECLAGARQTWTQDLLGG